MKTLFLLGLFLYFPAVFAAQEVVNVYIWANWLSPRVVQQFEKESGIRVNLSTYDSNETLYAKLKAAKNPGYDVIAPSSFYVNRMYKEGLLAKIDKKRLSNFVNLDRHFLYKAYDPHNDYSVPFAWGITGIFYNTQYYPEHSIEGWADFWDKKYHNQLLLMDDPRDVIPMALVIMGYSVNDTQPEHLKQAYLKLRKMLPNVKLFNIDAIASILIDEDATIGMAWNGDAFRAHRENPHIQFVFPKEGFLIWLDCLAVAKDAPHLDNAHKFIDFILRPDIASSITLDYGFATANVLGQKRLPPEIRNNPVINPPPAVLERGEIQKDIGDTALAIYEKYWERLKMAESR
jgi:spermidine/putrescine transport system substrate-binding protein